jgi:hypothetical protein
MKLGMIPGPEIGTMLEQLEDARRESVVSDRDEAIAWVKARLEGQG